MRPTQSGFRWKVLVGLHRGRMEAVRKESQEGKTEGESLMSRKVFLVILLGVSLCVCLVSTAQQKPLTNKVVIDMVKGGLAESVIISAIQLNAANYDVSPAPLLALKKARVTPAEQDAMATELQALASVAYPATQSSTSQQPRPPIHVSSR